MTKREVEQEAHRILRECSATVPMDVDMIAGYYGVQVEYPDLEDGVSGMLLMKDGRAVIGVNVNHAATRQRFTMAHELGHYFLHRDSGKIFLDGKQVLFRNAQSSDGTQLQEILANTFAAALLIPADQVRKHAQKMVDDEVEADVAVWNLAQIFEVSEEAMRLRLINLGYEVG